MADVTMTVVDAVKAGILDVGGDAEVELGNAAGAGFHFYMPNDGKIVLACVCGAAPKAITFTAVLDKFGRTETLVVTPGTSKTSIIGPFMPQLWNQAGGLIKFQPADGGLATDLYLAVRVSRPT